MPISSDIFEPVLNFVSENKSVLILLATSAIGSGFGAWFGARAILSGQKKEMRSDIQATANIAIATLVALLTKLLNFKKDLAFPALAEAETLSGILSDMAKGQGEKSKITIKLELWPETPFALNLPNDKIYAYAGRELDVVQLLKTLEYNLYELRHMVTKRNDLIRHMNAHQASKGVLPQDGISLYLQYVRSIAQAVDENLFFIDKAIGSVRGAAQKLLPKSMHSVIADVGLRPETGPLMPPKDFLKGWVK